MTCFRNKAGVAPILVFAVLLIAAQSIVSTHEFRHDTGKAQNQVCTTCVAASQLGSACVDSCASGEIEAYSPTTGSSVSIPSMRWSSGSADHPQHSEAVPQIKTDVTRRG